MPPGISGTRLEYQHSRGIDRQISEFKASLSYRVSFRTARAVQRNPVLKNKTKNNSNKKNVATSHAHVHVHIKLKSWQYMKTFYESK